MSVWGDRVTWLGSYNTYAQLSRDYAIPYRTLLSTRTTGIVPTDYRNNYDRLWSNESYSAARQEGVPVYASSKVRGGALQTIQDQITGWNSLYDYWAVGAVGTTHDTYDQTKWGTSEWSDFYSIRSKIVKSSQSSDITAADATERNTSM